MKHFKNNASTLSLRGKFYFQQQNVHILAKQ